MQSYNYLKSLMYCSEYMDYIEFQSGSHSGNFWIKHLPEPKMTSENYREIIILT